jgi:cellulose synthase/poly-beta-1,6-N-acetylglucosamine synthase-like glycosyltransferase
MHIAHVMALVALVLIVALPATLACIYLLVLTCLSSRIASPPAASRRLRFDVIVPAHDEAVGIEMTLASLQQLDWPQDRYRIVVVADNCTDGTAEIARRAGAIVIERHDMTRRGKGYALAHAFNWSCADGFADAVAVVDADTVVSGNLLQSFNAHLVAGESAVQAHYGVLNAAESWRTRLMAIALGAIHRLRSRARERLGLSCGIRGNGWCVTHRLLGEIPYRAFSLTEDVEFGVDLALAGHRVAYNDDCSVHGEMVSSADAARSQRQRWEGGRLALIRSKAPALICAAIARRSRVCLDLGLDLLVLPLSYVVLNVIAIAVLGLLNPAGLRPVLLATAVADTLALSLYVWRGWALSEVGPAGLWDLLRVPGFLVWKLLILRFQPKPDTWVRTRRQG